MNPIVNNPGKQRLRLWLRMLRTTRMLEARVRNLLRTEFSETLPRFDVMAALYRDTDGITMGELSRMLMVSNGNVTGIVERLVDDGLVERIAIKGDRRAIKVRLTENGTRHFSNLAVAHESWVDGLLQDISAAQADQMIGLLKTIQTRGKQ